MSKPFGLAIFDVDSTLVTIEGIDRLADGDPRIAELTDQAMNGTIAIDEVYAKRLDIVRPTLTRVRELGDEYIRSVTPGAIDTIRALRNQGVDVHLVTAGIEQAILPLAEHLGLSKRAVHAVRLSFDSDGNYVDFDRSSPLTRNGGKETVVINLRVRAKGRVLMVGDGASDLEAKPAVDLFIGFGGVVARERVRAGSHRYIDVLDLTPVLKFAEEWQ